ncbi:MAG: molecular chaperone HtpG [Lachnospiraceae bacterium]|nr:molecular chaperone HtpG [Lachnospiraceae bacterium]
MAENKVNKGSLSINSENIFPIIKKWLYSDHDIFLRELVSNGCDAITKLKKLDIMGEFTPADDENYKIDVIASSKDKTLTIIDNGLGMTKDEVNEYINQIAFSGAAAFLEKYKDKANEEQIIGHFGLGFYSAFMVADKVTIDTKSYRKGTKPVHWECEGGTEYEMSAGDKTDRGTKITLYLNEDCYEFSNEFRVKEILDKYCSFMPVPIFFTNADEALEKKDEVIDVDTSEEKTEAEGEEAETKENEGPKPVNDPSPLWTKHPNDCTEEEYKDFYRKVFRDFKEPLFWIHLNMDYPFNLKGILYFPKLNTEYDTLEGTIKLYNNQVFIADNIKEVIPEFLMLLKGVIDCPDLPLNVSRSALQNDGFVKKISDYITKKVADKLAGMCKTDKEEYEKFWDDLSPFIKFGCLKDDKFNEKMTDYILFKNIEGKYVTLPEYLEAGKEKYENKVFYITDKLEQASYIKMFEDEGMDAVLLDHNIDNPFITHLEQANSDVKFLRIDADLENFKEEVSEDELKDITESLTETFKKVLDNDKLNVKVDKLKNADISSMLTVSEDSRRMAEMMKAYGMGMGDGIDPAMFGGEGETLVLNANNDLVKYVIDNKEGDTTELVVKQLYDLAVLANHPLPAEQMTEFVKRSNEILKKLTV